jgi:hypothetical protein
MKKTATEMTNLLHKAHGENTLTRTRVIWTAQEVFGRHCRLVTMKTDENVEKARTLC